MDWKCWLTHLERVDFEIAKEPAAAQHNGWAAARAELFSQLPEETPTPQTQIRIAQAVERGTLLLEALSAVRVETRSQAEDLYRSLTVAKALQHHSAP